MSSCKRFVFVSATSDWANFVLVIIVIIFIISFFILLSGKYSGLLCGPGSLFLTHTGIIHFCNFRSTGVFLVYWWQAWGCVILHTILMTPAYVDVFKLSVNEKKIKSCLFRKVDPFILVRSCYYILEPRFVFCFLKQGV